MKYKKQLLILMLLGGFFSTAQAQDASAATGGEATGAGGTASYTIGQPMYQTNTGGGLTEVQGVQQPYEISVVTALNDIEGISLLFSAYPNPTNNQLNLRIEKYPTKGLFYQLTDVNGKILQSKKIENELTEISLSSYASASYFLSVSQNNQLIKSFKILKN